MGQDGCRGSPLFLDLVRGRGGVAHMGGAATEMGETGDHRHGWSGAALGIETLGGWCLETSRQQ